MTPLGFWQIRPAFQARSEEFHFHWKVGIRVTAGW